MDKTPAQLAILVVEDSDEDFEAITWAIAKLGLIHPVIRCSDGATALAYLAEPEHSPYPALVLLDMNLPRMDGQSVLRAIKTDATLWMLPVIILTTSSNPFDIRACYRAGANGYVIKPVDLHKFVHNLETVIAYWFKTVALPEVEQHI